MKISDIPFLIVFISLFFPIISAFTQSYFTTLIVDILACSSFLYLSIFKKFTYPRKFLFFILSPLLIQAVYSLIFENGLGSKALIGIVILIWIFFEFLSLDKQQLQSKALFRQIQFIYIFLIGALILEIFLRLTGYNEMLFYPISTLNIDSEETLVKAYKFYNAGTLFQFIGFKDMTGPNSVLLGSQAASQIVSNGIIIFSPIYLRSKIKLISDKYFLFYICLFLYPFVATLTSNVILIINLFIIFFILPNSKLNNNLSRLKSFFIGLFLLPFIPLLWFRIRDIDDVGVYLKAFIAPVDEFLKLDINSKLFGIGLEGIKNLDIYSADFGLGVLILSNGIIVIGLLIGILLIVFFRTMKLIKVFKDLGEADNPLVYLASVNILCVFSWLISLIHYTQAFELGGRHIFSFHLAISWIVIIRANQFLSKLENKNLYIN